MVHHVNFPTTVLRVLLCIFVRKQNKCFLVQRLWVLKETVPEVNIEWIPLLMFSCSDLGRFGYIFYGSSTQGIRTNSIRVPRGVIGPQCLRYFQYMTANRNGQSIEVGIESPEINQTIDRTTEKPYNGWISRNVSFFSPVANYLVR